MRVSAPLDVGLYSGLPISIGAPNNPSNLVPLLVLPFGIAGGFACGSLVARRVTRSLEKTEVFRPTRRRLLSLLTVIVLAVSGYILLIDLVLKIIRPLLIGTFSLLASMFAAQSIMYMRWERRTGKRIEYEGAWGVKATSPANPPKIDIAPSS